MHYYLLPFLKEESVSRLLEDDKFVKDFNSSISSMNKSTAEKYLSRLNIFRIFLNKDFDDLTITGLINKIKDGYVDSYSVLSRYCSYLRSSGNISTITIKQRVVTVKNFFEYYDIDINPRKFKLKVRLPKAVKRNK